MKRSELINYSHDYQRAIFRAFTPEQRLLSWQEKLNEVLSLNWEKDERLHIMELNSKINTSWFNESLMDNTQARKNRDQFLSNWISFGIDELAWPKALIHSMIIVIETNKSANGYLLESIPDLDQNKTYKTSGEGTCRCSTESDWCGSDLGTCQEDDCTESSLGCGTLWTYTCDGKCKLGIINQCRLVSSIYISN